MDFGSHLVSNLKIYTYGKPVGERLSIDCRSMVQRIGDTLKCKQHLWEINDESIESFNFVEATIIIDSATLSGTPLVPL